METIQTSHDHDYNDNDDNEEENDNVLSVSSFASLALGYNASFE